MIFFSYCVSPAATRGQNVFDQFKAKARYNERPCHRTVEDAQNIQYDKRHKVKQVQLTVARKVLLHHSVAQSEKPRKFQTHLTGPFEIKKVLPNNVYILERMATHQTLKAPLHADKLTVYIDPSPNTGDIFKHTDPFDVINTEACKTLLQPIQPNAHGSIPLQNPVQHNSQAIQDTPVADKSQVAKILKCQRYRSSKLYKVKLSSNKTCWLHNTDIVEALRSQFHRTKTMSGTARKNMNKHN